MRKWIGPDQARPVQDCQSGAQSSPTFRWDRTGLSPTPDRVRPDWWNHCRRLDLTGQTKPSETRSLTGTGPGLDCQEAADQVFGQFWNWTEPLFWSKPGPLAGYPDPLLTLMPWLWGIGKSHCSGHNKDKVHTLILTNIMISATICHPLPTTHHVPPGAWWLKLCKSLDQIRRSIHGSI